MKTNVRIGVFRRLAEAQQSFSFTEKVLFYTFALLLVLSTLTLLGMLNNKLLTTVPAPGGTITEGVIGTPRFINPVLALSDADRDLTALVYTGLMRATPDGTLKTDLAESVDISEDGLTYTFKLRENARFHDGSPVTAEDIIYTIELAQDSQVKSPKRANWEGVRAVALDEHTVQFTLTQTYAPFLENTTMGILPKHIWEQVPPEQLAFSTFNAEPIGAGPFQVTDTERNRAGVPTKYTLGRFDDYILGAPYIESIVLRFYPNQEELLEAFAKGTVDNINAIGPEELLSLEQTDTMIHTSELPRIFGIFFNQDESTLFTDSAVREALNYAVDREAIVSEVLGGYGVPVYGPLPPQLTQSLFGSTYTPTTIHYDPEHSAEILADAGWEISEDTGVLTNEDDVPIKFTLVTSNAPELQRVAELVEQNWEQLGIEVQLAFFDTGALNQEKIRPRDYDALLFGQIIGRDLDPFAFWHSSQREDPGLNIALYANITADEALEKIRTTFDTDTTAIHYQTLEEEISIDMPAVFLYSPEFIYVTSRDLKGVANGTITTPDERFLNVHEFHIFTQSVWSFLAT